MIEYVSDKMIAPFYTFSSSLITGFHPDFNSQSNTIINRAVQQDYGAHLFHAKTKQLLNVFVLQHKEAVKKLV